VVSLDASATARNLSVSESLFRLGFAGYLVEAVCDVSLTFLFFVLLRPVDGDLALLSAFFGLLGTAVFCFAELFYFAVSLLIGNAGYLRAFSREQLDALILLSLKLYSCAGGAFLVFGGVGAIVTGRLIVRSGYLPKALGVLFGLGGIGFVIRNIAFVLAPKYAFDWLFLPTNLAMLSSAVWLLTRGVNIAVWREKAAMQGHP